MVLSPEMVYFICRFPSLTEFIVRFRLSFLVAELNFSVHTSCTHTSILYIYIYIYIYITKRTTPSVVE